MELWVFVSQSPLYSHLKTQHVTCCKRLHTSANIAQQETTMLAQQCCVRLHGPLARVRVRLLFRVFLLFCFLCVTSSVSFTGFHTQRELRVEGLPPILMQRSDDIVLNRSHSPFWKVFAKYLPAETLKCLCD